MFLLNFRFCIEHSLFMTGKFSDIIPTVYSLVCVVL
jgi:hypothetical protein